MMDRVFAYLVHMKEEYREVEEDDNKEGQDEDNGQRGEDPQQVFQKTQVVLRLIEASPFLPYMKHTHLWTKTVNVSIVRFSTTRPKYLNNS